MPSKNKKYIVSLSLDERQELKSVISAKVCSKEKRLRAYILLKSDEGRHGKSWSDAKIVESYDVSSTKIEKLRKRLVEDGFEAALYRKKRLNPPSPRKLDGVGEAHLIALCCSNPPLGYKRWSLKLLAGRIISLEIVETISSECVRQTLKKMNLNLG